MEERGATFGAERPEALGAAFGLVREPPGARTVGARLGTRLLGDLAVGARVVGALAAGALPAGARVPPLMLGARVVPLMVGVRDIPERDEPPDRGVTLGWLGVPRDGARAEGALAEGVLADGVRAEGVLADGVRAEGVRADGARADGALAEGVRADGVRADGVRAEGVRADGARADGVRLPGVLTAGSLPVGRVGFRTVGEVDRTPPLVPRTRSEGRVAAEGLPAPDLVFGVRTRGVEGLTVPEALGVPRSGAPTRGVLEGRAVPRVDGVRPGLATRGVPGLAWGFRSPVRGTAGWATPLLAPPGVWRGVGDAAAAAPEALGWVRGVAATVRRGSSLNVAGRYPRWGAAE